MNGPRRLKLAKFQGASGRLLAAGCDELPDSTAIERTARRLGLPATLLTSAALSTALTSASAAASVTAGGSATAGVTLGALGATKAALIGVGIGLSLAVGAAAVRSKTTGNGRNSVASISSLPAPLRPLPDSNHSLIPPIVEAPTTAGAVDSPNSRAAASQSPPRVESSPDTPESVKAVASIGRFDDLDVPSAAEVRKQADTAADSSQAAAASLANANRTSAGPVDPRLAREVASLDRVRAVASRGDAPTAMRELDAFSNKFGYIALQLEAKLVRIDLLLALGRRTEAAQLARAIPVSGVPVAQRKRLEQLIRDQE